MCYQITSVIMRMLTMIVMKYVWAVPTSGSVYTITVMATSTYSPSSATGAQVLIIQNSYHPKPYASANSPMIVLTRQQLTIFSAVSGL